MLAIKCNTHNVNYRLPDSSEELFSGDYHNDIKSVEEHLEKHPDCIFQEVVIE